MGLFPPFQNYGSKIPSRNTRCRSPTRFGSTDGEGTWGPVEIPSLDARSPELPRPHPPSSLPVGGVRVPAELSVRVPAGLSVRVSAGLAAAALAGPGPVRWAGWGGAELGGAGRGARGGRPPEEEAEELDKRRKGGGPAGLRGQEEADRSGVWGAERPGPRGAAEHGGLGSEGLGRGSAARGGECREAGGGGQGGSGCAGDRGGSRAVRGPQPGRRRLWIRRAGPGRSKSTPPASALRVPGRPSWRAKRASAAWASAPAVLLGPQWRRPANGDPKPGPDPGVTWPGCLSVCREGRSEAGGKLGKP